ncbi:merozoite surface protein 3 precursor, putative [Perkinsus marinus ATCC 50983]|uniref:Merozoite surface protein 3, putative n=1 Tax=Perkinsus marinus (strain ATCC 50983 / TXsc) TaxID=423536 RepID=C5KZ64_PERM5|nr:merozoite surface protein 3 precursor, putative [Perkinsus marinus ATCC 50983]EER10214.1 merozoite surface protein 3 precursor, putative [Perkinsus marinus ATCC 50983]|eukprot:XP_002778419.1 merozoite surface protein 3 precursor, putative [Perkinsus marinus ATCC 50983]
MLFEKNEKRSFDNVLESFRKVFTLQQLGRLPEKEFEGLMNEQQPRLQRGIKVILKDLWLSWHKWAEQKLKEEELAQKERIKEEEKLKRLKEKEEMKLQAADMKRRMQEEARQQKQLERERLREQERLAREKARVEEKLARQAAKEKAKEEERLRKEISSFLIVADGDVASSGKDSGPTAKNSRRFVSASKSGGEGSPNAIEEANDLRLAHEQYSGAGKSAESRERYRGRRKPRCVLVDLDERERPPVQLIMSCESKAVSGRHPFGKDAAIDYEMDSDAEWAELAEGEDLGEDDDVSEDEETASDADSCVVSDGKLSADEMSEDEECAAAERELIRKKIKKRRSADVLATVCISLGEIDGLEWPPPGGASAVLTSLRETVISDFTVDTLDQNAKRMRRITDYFPVQPSPVVKETSEEAVTSCPVQDNIATTTTPPVEGPQLSAVEAEPL